MKSARAIVAIALACVGNSVRADVSQFVDPFIGTGGTGHCNPGAARPFSFVKPGPDTGNGSWAYCGGYRYEDNMLDGFSQTHLSGVGRAEMGDVLLLPFTGEKVRRRVSFTHKGEIAKPGYYAVTLDDGKVCAELTATRVVAFHRYTFKAAPARLIVDFQHGLTSVKDLVATHVLTNVCMFGEDGRSIQGWTRVRKNWPEHSYYYSLVFDHSIRGKTLLAPLPGEKGGRYVLDFDLKEGNSLQVKVAFSMNSVENAVANGKTELPDWNFERVRSQAAAEWEELLSRVELETPNQQLLRNFYTALYHAFLHPDNVADVGEAPRYSTFSLWDTFRAAHPLYTLLVPERVEGFVASILDFQKSYGYLPIWMMWGREGYCMIGNHAVPVLLDAWKKGFKFDRNAAYEAVRTSLLKSYPADAKANWAIYDKYGYYPYDLVPFEGVSRVMECTFDDWCAEQMARMLGYDADARRFEKRANYWRNVFDFQIGFVRGKDSHGAWRAPYDPEWYGIPRKQQERDFTEGNGWQYTFHVLHDVPGLVAAFGGKERLLARLDELFTTQSSGEILCQDATGNIGQYAHGNEPCHHVAWLYALLGERRKTVERVEQICREFYKDTPEGLCGNDDCGQMSAWYVFATLGFYPYNPASAEYVWGVPRVPKAVIRLWNGKKLNIVKEEHPLSTEIGVSQNGAQKSTPVISHQELIEGGTLLFKTTENSTKNERIRK